MAENIPPSLEGSPLGLKLGASHAIPQLTWLHKNPI
jgi:hypothetical protein